MAGGILVLLIGCSSQTKQKWLTTFFDGVPQGGVRTNRQSIVYDENGKPMQVRASVTTNYGPAEAPFFVPHPPFEQKICTDCHESKYSVRLKAPEKQVCFACHRNFLAQAPVKHLPVDNGECTACHNPHGSAFPMMLVRQGKELCFDCHDDVLAKVQFKHKPVEAGECSTCHNAHASTNQFLLSRPGQRLCFECHQNVLTAGVKYRHAPAEMGECTFCHNSHGANNQFLLNRTGKSLCFDCHEDFLTQAKFKHVAVEDCSACHFSHQSNEPFLLVKERQQLCYGCHVKKDMAELKGHAGMGDASCLKCHNPHSGDDKYLLKPGVARPGGNQVAAGPSSIPAK